MADAFLLILSFLAGVAAHAYYATKWLRRAACNHCLPQWLGHYIWPYTKAELECRARGGLGSQPCETCRLGPSRVGLAVYCPRADAGQREAAAALDLAHTILPFPATWPHPAHLLAKALVDMRDRKDAAYYERNQVVALAARLAMQLGWRVERTRTAIEGWSPDWHGRIYIQLPTGQVSWHFHDSQANLFGFIPEVPSVAWDGHDTPEKYRRVAQFAAGGTDG